MTSNIKAVYTFSLISSLDRTEQKLKLKKALRLTRQAFQNHCRNLITVHILDVGLHFCQCQAPRLGRFLVKRDHLEKLLARYRRPLSEHVSFKAVGGGGHHG